MSEAIQCPECGAPLPPNWPKGLCSRCALQGALELTPAAAIATVRGGTPPPAGVAEQPGDHIGRYKLLEKIGEGGCGVVYMAEQEEPVRRRVALKVIKPGMDTREVIARFEAERQALALMEHPHIAKVFDGGATDAGRPYFVMELVRGLRITDYCDRKNLSTRQRLDLFMQVCQAVQHAHQKGIIHRDLKPSNILVTVNDGVAVPKVIDFGIAKATGQRLTDKTLFTKFQQLIGTPAYMSPEQAEMTSVDIDTRSDIYSLGVLLYELLTGRTPFDTKELLRAGMDQMLRTIREQEPVRPSARLGTLAAREQTTVAQQRQTDAPKLINLVRGDLDWIVMKALEKDRTRRYETANGLATDLKRHLGNEPVMARPPSTVYRFQKAFRRNKLAFTAAAAVGGVLIVGVMVSTWQAFEASRARNAEKEQRLAAEADRDIARTAKKEAEGAQQTEKQERLRADTEKLTAQRNLYLANMSQAEQAWEKNNIGRLRRLLEDTRDSPERGFEWYYWQGRTHLERRTLRGHPGRVVSVAFSTDGTRIVSGSADGTVKGWETSTGRELLTLKLNSAGSRVLSVALSPDGDRIVTGNSIEANVWDFASGQKLVTLKGHLNGMVSSVAFSPDSRRIVSGGCDGTAKIWETDTGRDLLTIQASADTRIANSAVFSAFSPDGLRIITGSEDGEVRVWESVTGRDLLTLAARTDSPGKEVLSAAFSADGKRIVTAHGDHTAKVWDANTGQELLTLTGHDSAVRAAAFSPDGQRIVTGSEDHTVKVWDWSGTQLASVESGRGKPKALNRRLEPVTLKGHSAAVSSVAFSPDGQWIVTGSWDHTVKIWQGDTDPEQPMLKGHTRMIYSLAFSSNGQQIATASLDHTAKVWDANSGRDLLTFKGHKADVRSVAFSPDGTQVITGSEDQTAKVWDAKTGSELLTLTPFRNSLGSSIYSVAFSSDARRIVTGGHGFFRMWEAGNGRELFTITGLEAVVYCVAFSPDSQRVVTPFGHGAARIWEVSSGRQLLTLTGPTDSMSVAFSPDGGRIVAGGDQTASVWDATTGRKLLTLWGHTGMILSVLFSPDGKRVITGSSDDTVKVWDASSGRELLTLKTFDGVWGLAISPDGRKIVGDCGDGTARIWAAASAERVQAWLNEETTSEKRSASVTQEEIK